MPETVFGLPIHPLVVHATVVVVPTAALVVALSVLLPRFRVWAGPLPVLLAAAAVVLSPLSTSTGESLEHQVGESSLVERHAELGEMLVWWSIGLLVVAAVGYWFQRGNRQLRPQALLGLAVAGVLVASGTLVQVALVGHSGAEAAWSDVAASPTAPGQ